MSPSSNVKNNQNHNTIQKRTTDKKPEDSSRLEKARKLHEHLNGRKSFKRARGSTIPKEIFGNCPDVAQRYEKIGRLGEGTYGVVYKARDRETGDIVALKRCLAHFENTDGFPVTTLREISILKSLSYGYGTSPHPSIVQLLNVAVSSIRKSADNSRIGSSTSGGTTGGTGVFLVFEYCEFDLAQLVDDHYASRSKSPFTEAQVKNLAIQLLKGLDFMHSRNILHRDIKLSNLLYSQRSRGGPRASNESDTNQHHSHLRIADFGLARKSTSSYHQTLSKRSLSTNTMLTPKVVSLWYRPPEILFESGIYNQAIDNWGAGCAIAELLEGLPLIKGRNEMDQIKKLFELLGPPTSRIWPELYDMPLVKSKSIKIHHTSSSLSTGTSLLDRFDSLSSHGLTLLSNLLQYDYKQRWSAAQALESQYFEENPMPARSENMPVFPTK